MSKFKPTDFNISPEPESLTDIRVKPLDSGGKPEVKEFQFKSLQPPAGGQYHSVKTKYGPLAATDPERNDRSQKDRRFSLNPLLKSPLSVEQEERRVMEEKVRARIQTLADSAKAEAAELGYAAGLKKGFEEAFKKFKDESAESLAKFNQLVSEAEFAKVEIFRANERFLIELVFRIARMVLLKEISEDKEYILRIAKELVSRVGARDNITIRINTEDAKKIEMLKESLEKAYGHLTNLNIEASTQVSRGGCQIETEWSAIDASVETQLQRVYESLIGQKSGGA